MSDTNTDAGHEEQPKHTADVLLTKVPGRTRLRTQALEEFEQDVAVLRDRYKPEFWPIFVPQAKDVYRWRVQLECGCVHEMLTRGEDRYPDSSGFRDPFTDYRLPAGEYWCWNNHGETGPHYRDVVEWVDRKVEEFPADPEEPQHGLDAETWALTRRSEPHTAAFWQVRLSCGHFDDCVVTDLDWKPEDGPKLVAQEHAVEMRRDMEAHWAEKGASGWPDHLRDRFRKMLDLRWPRPEPDLDCRSCRYSKRMTGCQRIGWLVPRRKSREQDPDAKRTKLEAQLPKAEAEVRRVRQELALDTERS